MKGDKWIYLNLDDEEIISFYSFRDNGEEENISIKMSRIHEVRIAKADAVHKSCVVVWNPDNAIGWLAWHTTTPKEATKVRDAWVKWVQNRRWNK